MRGSHFWEGQDFFCHQQLRARSSIVAVSCGTKERDMSRAGGIQLATDKHDMPMTMAVTYAPTIQSTMEVKESFYDLLRSRIKGTRTYRGMEGLGRVIQDINPRPLPSSHFYLAMGDFNVRVGGRQTLMGFELDR